jgi:CheY-like chemotaxis protein
LYELAWFVAGAAAAFALVRRPAVRKHALPSRRLAAPKPPDPPPARAPNLINARRVALTLAEDLATLVSGIEGRAHALIEAAPQREMLPAAAEGLCTAIQRLRTLQRKLVAFGRARTAVPGSTEVRALVAGLTDELLQMQLGLELSWEPPQALPPIAADPDIVRDSLVFLCAALLRAERGATHLTIEAGHSFAGDAQSIRLQLSLEWITETVAADDRALNDANLTLDLEAANHLIACQGGTVSISHLPGRSVRAIVHWPAALEVVTPVTAPEPKAIAASPIAPPALPQKAPAAERELRGRGALVLEADPAVRQMISDALKASRYAVFVCSDGAAACAFLKRTPDRFEIIILDHEHRLDGGDALGETIRTLVPSLKICVLVPGPAHPATTWPQLHCIEKPFGVHELRRALASVLAG